MDRAWVGLKKIFRKWIKENKNVLLIAFIAGFFSHIYGITNMLGGDDRILNYYTGRSTIGLALQRANTGRWLATIVELGLGWYKSPVVTGFFTIIIMAISAVIFSEIFDIKDDKKRSLVAIMFEVFPAVCVFITLAPDTFSYGVSFLVCNIAMYLLVKRPPKTKNVICNIIVLFIGLSLFLPNISVILIAMIYYVLYQILIEQKASDIIVTFIKRSIVVILISAILYYTANIVIINAMHIELSDYQGASDAITGKFINNILTGALFSLFKTWKHSYEWMYMIPQLKFTLIVSYIIVALSIIYLWINNKIYKKMKSTIIMLICIVFIPFSLSPMSLISYSFRYRAQHCLGWLVLLTGTIIFGSHLIHVCRKGGVIRLLIIINLSLQVYGFFLFDQVEYYNMSYVWEKDKTFCTRILCRLDNMKEFDYDKAVYFLDTYDLNYEDSNTILAYDWNLYMNITNSTTNLTGGNTSYKAHIKNFEGVILKDPSQETIDKINNSELVLLSESLSEGEFEIVQFDADTFVILVHHTASPSWEFS